MASRKFRGIQDTSNCSSPFGAIIGGPYLCGKKFLVNKILAEHRKIFRYEKCTNFLVYFAPMKSKPSEDVTKDFDEEHFPEDIDEATRIISMLRMSIGSNGRIFIVVDALTSRPTWNKQVVDWTIEHYYTRNASSKGDIMMFITRNILDESIQPLIQVIDNIVLFQHYNGEVKEFGRKWFDNFQLMEGAYKRVTTKHNFDGHGYLNIDLTDNTPSRRLPDYSNSLYWDIGAIQYTERQDTGSSSSSSESE